ncbi:MAG: nuclear transport factor 2 family protein [Hyphomicrobiales bacterium]|nr:MAG: nuclear transport factor 2 family protein [Hyphomicrobiales bacterium]
MNDHLLHRLDRVESAEAIRQLVSRYGVLIDSRDLDALVELYVEDFRVARDLHGRAALRATFERMLGAEAPFTTTIHFVGNQTIDFDETNPDRASGVVYCRAEHEFPDLWVVATLQYWDTYERRDGKWYFAQRKLKAFYAADVLERPNGPDRIKRQVSPGGLLSTAEVPESWPSWQRFQTELYPA